MKGFAIVLIVVGVILLVAGFGIQGIAASNSDFQQASAMMEQYLGTKLTPESVGNLLNHNINLGYGISLSFKEILSYAGTSSSDIAEFETYARVYAATPTMIYSGIGALALGIILNIAAKKSRGTQRPAASDETFESMDF